jgi:asparagine synthetase B (glutamine-hydrolysing)
MCGIFGIVVRDGVRVAPETLASLLSRLFILSESRGRESAGLHATLPHRGAAWTLKGGHPASEFIRSPEYRGWIAELAGDGVPAPLAILAHSRLVTNGAAEDPHNNQPVRSGRVTMIHNGIVVNADALWTSNPDLTRKAEVDTEVLAALADLAIQRGAGPEEATAGFFSQLEGSASVAWTRENAGWVALATNTGDLYVADTRELLVFASERHILEQSLGGSAAVDWLPPERGLLVSFDETRAAGFDLRTPVRGARTPIGPPVIHRELATCAPPPAPPARKPSGEGLLRYRAGSLRRLRRCSRCVLPETFPMIRFDAAGVCHYCRYHRPRYRGVDPGKAKQAFIESLAKYRSRDRSPDVLVALSGGRDSSYGLHLIKKEFGLSPVTFTYDWGMVTDLARRNVARLCGKLGVQNILVSADIRRKRDYIRMNVEAWLRKPDLGLVPLFMAGDKEFFCVVNRLKRQTGLRLNLWCANPYENTDFKAGFCGVPPDVHKKRVDYLSDRRKARLVAYYLSGFLRNPGYWNSSLLDSARAFKAFYLEERRDFFFVFDHLVWDEAEVVKTLRTEYDWETAPDTKSTWRIGDGTAAFYNYIYVTARGFSEFDTFRSNQIREGVIGRELALEEVVGENQPRPESIRWYLDTVGLDHDETIRRINALDVLGLHS